jgi:hypothetical protein
MAEQAATLMTPKLRVRYENFFKTGMADDNGKSFFEGTLVVDAAAWNTPEMKAIRAACETALKKKFPTATADEMAEFKRPFRKCGTKPKTYGPEFADCLFFKVKSTKKPGVVDAKVQPIIDPSEAYAGCYARISVHPFAYDVKGGKGVSLWMNNVQILPGGDPLSGGARAADEFTAVDTEDVGQSVDDMFAADA